MRASPHAANPGNAAQLGRRLGWFILLWAASVAALGVVAMILRAVVAP